MQYGTFCGYGIAFPLALCYLRVELGQRVAVRQSMINYGTNSFSITVVGKLRQLARGFKND